mgnify:FL=1
MKRYYLFFAVVIAVSLTAAVSLYLVRRGPVADQLLSNDMRAIASEIDNYYLTKNELPASLSQITFSTADLIDRARTLEYRVMNNGTTSGNQAQYELCATFRADQTSSRSTINYGAAPNPDYHGKGRQCFTYTELAAFK